ncbi:metallophosphoesterase [Anaerotruncus sp. CAG:390]|nr:metallophosphoesterase [Anaerotruncus sp. CAG:390]
MKKEKRIIIASDAHFCHIDWYGVPTRERIERMARDLNAEYERDPYEFILFLGDYSLDHWKWLIKGSYLARGICNTTDFINTCCCDLPTPYYMIAGNHEQYGDAKWREITGFPRSFTVECGNYVFILWDSYGADLDPTEHSDGTYTPMDIEGMRKIMNSYPGKKFILCSHHVYITKESSELGNFLADPDILCLFAGHNHCSNIAELPAGDGIKNLLRTGNYSYSGMKKDTLRCMWGFRDLYLGDHSLRSAYLVQEKRCCDG